MSPWTLEHFGAILHISVILDLMGYDGNISPATHATFIGLKHFTQHTLQRKGCNFPEGLPSEIYVPNY